VGGVFGLVMENLEFLAKTVKKAGANTDIIWNFIVFRHNEHEVEIAKQISRSIGVNFRLGLMRTSMKDEILLPHKEAIAKDLDWIPNDPSLSAYDKKNLRPVKIIKSCRKPWQEISVNWDGKVFACCAVFGDKYNIGSAANDKIREIWNNRMYVASRANILGKTSSLETICGLCRKNGFMHM
jgi:radical SAM protein with 4Fe4S-binding SPASM domain